MPSTVWPMAPRDVGQARRPGGETHAVRPMPAVRRWLVYALAAVIIAGPPVAKKFGTRRVYWPFSVFRMYSIVHADGYATQYVCGVTADAAGREVSLMRYEYTQPLTTLSLHGIVRTLSKSDDGRLDEAAAALLDRYELLRERGDHDGPPIAAVRVYRHEWDRLQPTRESVFQPDRRVLLAEAAVGEKDG